MTHKQHQMLQAVLGARGPGRRAPRRLLLCSYLGGGNLPAARGAVANHDSPALRAQSSPKANQGTRHCVQESGMAPGRERGFIWACGLELCCCVTSHPKPTSPRPTP